MADTIKIGSFEVSSFKVGSSDCQIYLGSTLLYPQSQPQVKDYLRFVARENASFTFSTDSISIQYSLNSGRTWTSLASDTSTPTIASGETIYWRASGLTPGSSASIGSFSSSGQFDIEGNIMSMLFGSDFEDKTDLTGYNNAFRNLFRANTNIINASGMTLPATTLAEGCYGYMFYNCSSLTTAPELPATTLENSCYYRMFYGCTNLTTAPELPAARLVPTCYREMFRNCSKLTNIRCYARNISASYCLTNWVNGVASSGTFTKAASMSSWTRGTSGIPSGWTVKNK